MCHRCAAGLWGIAAGRIGGVITSVFSVDPSENGARNAAMTIDHAAQLDDHCGTARGFPAAPPLVITDFERSTDATPRRSMSDTTKATGSNSTNRTADPTVARLMAEHIQAIAERQDNAAFEALFRHFGPRVKAYMLKLGADNALAEELMQESLVSVWRKAGKFDPSKAAASTWIFTIARNLRIDAYRKASRPEPDPNDPAFVSEGETPADDAMMQSEIAERLRSIIATLPEEQRTMLQLSYYQDKSHSEISEDFGIPLGTVKSRLRLAMQKVRHALGEDV